MTSQTKYKAEHSKDIIGILKDEYNKKIANNLKLCSFLIN